MKKSGYHDPSSNNQANTAPNFFSHISSDPQPQFNQRTSNLLTNSSPTDKMVRSHHGKDHANGNTMRPGTIVNGINRNVYLNNVQHVTEDNSVRYSSKKDGMARQKSTSKIQFTIQTSSQISGTQNLRKAVSSEENSSPFHKKTENSSESTQWQYRHEYLKILHETFESYERTGQKKVIKDFCEKNRLLMIKFVEQIGNLKEQGQTISIASSKITSRNSSEIRKSETSMMGSNDGSYGVGVDEQKSSVESKLRIETVVNQSLEKQLKDQIDICQGRNFEISQVRGLAFLRQMEATIESLNVEMGKINKKNQESQSKINTLPFYKEWMQMCQQAEGAKKYNAKLKEQLEIKKSILSQAKGSGSAAKRENLPNRSNQKPKFSQQSPDLLLPKQRDDISTFANTENFKEGISNFRGN